MEDPSTVAMAGGALSADPDRCGTRLKLSEDGNFANAGNAPPLGTYCGFTQEQIKNRSRDGLRESTSQAPPLGLWWGAVVSRICYAAPSSISETLANLQLGVGLTMNAFYKVQTEERQAIIDGELDIQQSTSGGASTGAPESQSSASPSTKGVRVVSEEEAAKYRLPPDKIKEALSEVTLADAQQVWADQWRGKTSALGIFETPGEFAQQNGSPDVNRPEHGLPEVNRRLFDILSQTTNQDIMEIETGGARGDNEFVPERLRNLVQQEDRSGNPAIHTAVIQLGSYANCFVIADETMNTLYVNFQLCNVPDHRQDLDLDKGTYSLLCQLAPATWGKRQGGENMVSLAFCSLDDQSVFKIIYTMNYMASTYLKWGNDECGAPPQQQEGGAVVPLDDIKNAKNDGKLGVLVKVAEGMAKLSETLAGEEIIHLKRTERDQKVPLPPETAWIGDFQVAACTIQEVLRSWPAAAQKSKEAEEEVRKLKDRVTASAKTFVDSAAQFVKNAAGTPGLEDESQQWAEALRGWVGGFNACGGKVQVEEMPKLPAPRGDILPVPGNALPPDGDGPTPPSSPSSLQSRPQPLEPPPPPPAQDTDGPGLLAPDPELSSDGSTADSDGSGLRPGPELSSDGSTADSDGSGLRPGPELSSDGSTADSDGSGLRPGPELSSDGSTADSDGSGLRPGPELSSDGSGVDTEGSVAESDGSGAESDGSGVDTEGSVAESEGSAADSEGSTADSEGSATDSEGSATDRDDAGETDGSIVESDADRPYLTNKQLRREMGERQMPPDTTSSPPVKTEITEKEAERGEGQTELDTFIDLVKFQASKVQENALQPSITSKQRKEEFGKALSKVTEMLESNLGVILNNARTVEMGEATPPQIEVTDMLARSRRARGQDGGAGEKIMEDINSLPDSQNNAKEMARKMQSAFQAFENYGDALGADSLTDDQIQSAYSDLTKNLDSLLDLTEPEQPVNQTVENVSDGCREADSSSSDMGDPDEVAKRKVYVTGYSVGGALASLFTLYYSEIRYASPEACGAIPYIPANILPPTTILTTYGAPPCGTNHRNAWDMQSVNRKMQNYIDGGAVVMRRYVTQGDPIPRVVPDDIGRRIGYTHMGNCCGTSVVRCPGTLNIFDGFLETLSNGIAGIASQQMKRGFQLFSTKKYDFQNNEIDEYGCRSWFIDKVDDPSRLKKPEQHADQCGIRFFIPLLALHLGASDGIARERSEEMGPRPIARKQADCSIYLPYEPPGSDGANTIRRLPLYSGDSPNPGNYCDFMVAATAAPDVQSADMDRVINTKYYDVLRSWGNMDNTGMAELKTKIANAVWGGPMGSVTSGYRYESVYGAVLATISFNQVQGCAYVQAPKGLSGESELAPGESVAAAPTTTPLQVKAQNTGSRRLASIGGVKRQTRDKRKKGSRRTRRA